MTKSSRALLYWQAVAAIMFPVFLWGFWLQWGPDDYMLQMLPLWYWLLVTGVYFAAVLLAGSWGTLVTVCSVCALMIIPLLTFACDIVMDASVTTAIALWTATMYGASRAWMLWRIDPEASTRQIIWHGGVSVLWPSMLIASTLGVVLYWYHVGTDPLDLVPAAIVLWVLTLVCGFMVWRGRRMIKRQVKALL